MYGEIIELRTIARCVGKNSFPGAEDLVDYRGYDFLAIFDLGEKLDAVPTVAEVQLIKCACSGVSFIEEVYLDTARTNARQLVINFSCRIKQSVIEYPLNGCTTAYLKFKISRP